MAGRRTDEQARATRTSILEAALVTASYKGFDGITIGGLAKDLGMSKAGILGHFATKEQLQIAAHAEASRLFRERVVTPAREHPEGIERLLAFCGLWADFIQAPPWPGGCVITAGSFEFDAQESEVGQTFRRGLIRWRDVIEQQAQVAIDHGDLPPGSDAGQVAYTIVALITGTIQAIQMHRDVHAAERLKHALALQLGRPLVAG